MDDYGLVTIYKSNIELCSSLILSFNDSINEEKTVIENIERKIDLAHGKQKQFNSSKIFKSKWEYIYPHSLSTWNAFGYRNKEKTFIKIEKVVLSFFSLK